MRRLPVIQQTDTDDALAASRPRWHWTLIGAGFAVTIWTPLAVVATPLGVRMAFILAGNGTALPSKLPPIFGILAALPVVAAFALAAWLAGALVGRFGGRARRRDAALSGAAAALIVTLLALLGGRNLPWLAVIAALVVLGATGAAFGALGAGFGLGRRPVLGSKAP